MANKKLKLFTYLYAFIVVVIAGIVVSYTWNLLKITPLVHQNSAKKAFDIKDSSLSQVKNPPSASFQAKSEAEGRNNPFAPY